MLSTNPLPKGEAPQRASRPAPSWLEVLRKSVEAVDFGSIQIKVHGGEVVQIETTRKIRVSSGNSGNSANPAPLPFQPTAPAEAQQPTS